MADNAGTIIGNLTRDPEVKYTPSGQAVSSFSVAVNRRWMNKQTNEWDESVSFFNVVAWRELAENFAESLKKGARVIVNGRFEQRQYEKDGEKRSVVEFIADDIGPSLKFATAQVEKTERTKGAPTPEAPPDYSEEPF